MRKIDITKKKLVSYIYKTFCVFLCQTSVRRSSSGELKLNFSLAIRTYMYAPFLRWTHHRKHCVVLGRSFTHSIMLYAHHIFIPCVFCIIFCILSPPPLSLPTDFPSSSLTYSSPSTECVVCLYLIERNNRKILSWGHFFSLHIFHRLELGVGFWMLGSCSFGALHREFERENMNMRFWCCFYVP